ncbi:hypothetical protein Ctha_0279 [Chloroherpeton thalassium ATCC 35110]|uniref:Uncharacterized protein n=1 Tax=Chloroherpeton thalassium (strain ATCC 35110 / GB-78) TaxID=517418 RepID=B3QTK4_CHLT3|nr:hypothetical protein [Chloroherpeton thalassium]ACF12750.1 hypothetical protein Ctha_0279 [Chloroherpeton thalassium ATCC 35110]
MKEVKLKLLNVEIAESEVNRLMREYQLGCLVKKFPSLTGDMYGAEVEVYLMDDACRRLGDGGVSDVGFAAPEHPDSPHSHAVAAEMALTKARRRAVLAFLGKVYEYSEASGKKKRAG